MFLLIRTDCAPLIWLATFRAAKVHRGESFGGTDLEHGGLPRGVFAGIPIPLVQLGLKLFDRAQRC